MSYIDTIDHEFVGFLAGLPVYHPLEAIADGDDATGDFNCTPSMLVVGGGSGEHPGMVLKRPDVAVAHFLVEWLESYTSDDAVSPEENERLQDRLSNLLHPNWGDVLAFSGWSVENYSGFLDSCTGAGNPNPFDPELHGSLEKWLAISLGELVFYSFPELASELLDELTELSGRVRPSLMNNVLIQPAGYPALAGRKIVDDELVWGCSSWNVNRATHNK